jgi:hypothetical protein
VIFQSLEDFVLLIFEQLLVQICAVNKPKVILDSGMFVVRVCMCALSKPAISFPFQLGLSFAEPAVFIIRLLLPCARLASHVGFPLRLRRLLSRLSYRRPRL